MNPDDWNDGDDADWVTFLTAFVWLVAGGLAAFDLVLVIGRAL